MSSKMFDFMQKYCYININDKTEVSGTLPAGAVQVMIGRLS